MTELAPRQREMLVFIARCIEANGYQPSYREIAKAFGWVSPGYCSTITKRLETLGIARNKGSRALSFDWKSYLKETKHDARRTDGVAPARRTRSDVRRGRGGSGDRVHRTRARTGRRLESAR